MARKQEKGTKGDDMLDMTTVRVTKRTARLISLAASMVGMSEGDRNVSADELVKRAIEKSFPEISSIVRDIDNKSEGKKGE